MAITVKGLKEVAQHASFAELSKPKQYFLVNVFACGHASQRGYKYCDLVRDGESQMMYCNFTKNRRADEIVRSFIRLLALHRVFDLKKQVKSKIRQRGLRDVIQVSKRSELSSRKRIPNRVYPT